MSRPLRINVPGGTYYIVQHGGARRPIFAGPEDYALFERLLLASLRRNGAMAYAYCWLPDAVHLVLRMGDLPLGRLMQGLTSRYARSIHRMDGEFGHFFRSRYQAVLVDAEAYLVKLIHYVHHLPVLSGLAPHPDDYAYTSHRAYLGVAESSWVHTRTALSTLDADVDPRCAYSEMMVRTPPMHDIELFRRSGHSDVRVIGSPEFYAQLPRHARTYRSKVTLEQIIYAVTQALGVAREHVMSSSRRRDLALARALIAWFACERHIATLTDVARRLNRDPSTISAAISRYRVLRPDLFRLNSLHYLTPMGPSDPQSLFGRADLEEHHHGLA